MKVHNIAVDHAVAHARGRVMGNRAGTGTITVSDGTTEVYAAELVIAGGTVTELADNVAQIIATSTAGPSLTPTSGGGAYVTTINPSGAAATLDLSTANVFDITLTASCTLTFTNPPASNLEGAFWIILRQGGSGSYTVTWPGTVTWQDTDGTDGGPAPTLYTAVGAEDVIVITTLDGGASYGGAREGALIVKDEGTALAGFAQSLDFVGAGVAATGTGAAKTITISGFTLTAAAVSALGFVGEILISDAPSTPLVFADLLQNDAQDDLMYADL